MKTAMRMKNRIPNVRVKRFADCRGSVDAIAATRLGGEQGAKRRLKIVGAPRAETCRVSVAEGGLPLFGFFLAALSVTGFAATFVFGGALTKECGVSAEVLSFLRFAIAGGTMLAAGSVTARGRARLAAPSRGDWLEMALLAPVGTCVMAWCVFMGCARVSTANASMADALTPLMIYLVDALVRRRADLKGLCGLVSGFVGAVLVIRIVDGDGLKLDAYSVGDVYILLSAATWGLYTVFGKRLNRKLGSSVFTTWTMLLGAAIIGLVLPFGDFAWPSTPMAWALAVGLGLVSTLMPFWTWNAAQKYLKTSTLAMTAYFTPVIAMAMGIAFLGDGVTGLQWLGTAFIVCSAVIETRR